MMATAREIRELREAGLNDAQIASELGMQRDQVRRTRLLLGLPSVKETMEWSQHHYVVYDAGGDRILASGTARECAEQLGIKRKSFYETVSKVRRGICTYYTIVSEPM